MVFQGLAAIFLGFTLILTKVLPDISIFRKTQNLLQFYITKTRKNLGFLKFNLSFYQGITWIFPSFPQSTEFITVLHYQNKVKPWFLKVWFLSRFYLDFSVFFGKHRIYYTSTLPKQDKTLAFQGLGWVGWKTKVFTWFSSRFLPGFFHLLKQAQNLLLFYITKTK